MLKFLCCFFVFVIISCKTYNSRELAKKYFPEGRYIEIQNQKIFVLEKNLEVKNRVPIFLLHGFSSNVHTWEDLINKFPLQYPVVALDMPGFGFSDKPNISYTREAYIQWLREIQNFYDFKKIILVGNSMGGEFALRYALKYPEAVHKIILINSAGLLESSQPPYFIKKVFIIFLNSFEFLFVNRTSIRFFLSSAFYDDSRITERKIDMYYLPLKTEGGTNAHKSLFLAPYQKITLEDLRKIQNSTLILWGLQDRWIPIEHAYWFYKNLKNAKLVFLPELGHVPQEERVEDLLPYLVSFLNEE